MQQKYLQNLGRTINIEYNVVITKDAEQDMENIYNHIALELMFPEYAMGQYNRIADSIMQLDTFPAGFRIVDFEPEHSMGLRRKFVIIIRFSIE